MTEIMHGNALRVRHRWPALTVPALVAFLAAFTALHFYMASRVGLSNDEAYYRLWSMHPALSYFDHPPMVAWMIAASRAVAGDTVLGIRAGAIVLYIIAGVALFRTAELLYSREFAITTCWIALAMPLLAVGGIIASPDIPSVLFWILTVWAVVEFSRSQNPRWWLAVGLFAGCGLISKYTNLFVGASILIWLVAVPGNAKSIRSPFFWAGGLLAAILTTPVVLWNYEHGWASFAMQFGRVTHATAGVPGRFVIELVATYLALASPVIGILAMFGLFGVTRSAISRRRSPEVLLCAIILPMLFYFSVHALHDRVHFNWMSPIYPYLAMCTARALEMFVPGYRRRRTFVWATGVGFFTTALIFAHAISPLVVPLRFDALSETRGWASFADAVNTVRLRQGAKWIATSSFPTTSQLAFSLGQTVQVQQINESIRYVDMGQSQMPETPALYVERAVYFNLDLLRSRFASVAPLGSITRPDGTVGGTQYILYLVAQPTSANPP